MYSKLVAPGLILAALFSTTAWGIPLYLNANLNYDGAGGGKSYSLPITAAPPGWATKRTPVFNCNICHSGTVPSQTNINAYAIAWRTA